VWITRKLMQTESAWNPKVMAGRVLTRVLPDSALHALQKRYYAYVLSHRLTVPEHDQFLAGCLVSEGDSVVDIGGSIGGYTRFLSERVGPRGHVYTFEPNPSTYDFISYNVASLKLSNVQLFNVAVSDTAGIAELKIPRYRWGSECHYDARLDGPIQPDWRSVSVKTGTLDSFVGDKLISFIKCDANFHELSCLRGAPQLLAKAKPAMLIEINPDPDDPSTSAYQTFGLLREAGYEGFWLKGDQLRRRRAGEKSQNYFFLMPNHIQLLSRLGVLQAGAPDSDGEFRLIGATAASGGND
jgi:FkbM family methyltransferase